MVRRQHATLELKHPLKHRKHIRVPSKRRVRHSKVVHSRTYTSSHTKPIASKSSHRMQPIPPQAALTYVRMVRRQHATLELKHPIKHCKRIRVPSKRRVRHSKVVRGRACTSSQTKPIPSQSSHRIQRIPPQAALTYVRMVRRQHATPELKHPLKHRKRIRVPSKRRVRSSKVVHGQSCTSSKTTQPHPLTITTPHATHPSPSSPHLLKDGSQAARDAGTQAPAQTLQAHPRAFQGQSTSQQGCQLPCLHVKLQHSPDPSQSSHRMQPIPPLAALTYVRMVRRQHATPELKHLLTHRKRIRVPSKFRVRRSKVAHGRAYTSNQ
jgi:hypothetical protein